MRSKTPLKKRYLALAVSSLLAGMMQGAQAEVAATHIYHNHMPNFWPYYDVKDYDSTGVGQPIRYMYDGQVINLKNNPPSDYTFYIPGSGQPMPHDDFVSYYSHHAKKGAYLTWPPETARNNNRNHPLSQTHVTMSASVINNVQSFGELGNLDGYYLGWGDLWREVQTTVKTTNGYNALDTIHFSGHHTMGPLVGNDYFLKDLIYHNVTQAQDYFIGTGSFRSSNGFFPTELGFSERIIPALTKLGIEWSVLGNVHYSRTLKDYPYLNDPGVDTLVSPPNRADLQNESNTGEWVSIPMFNEQQVTQNKFPFASIPHWVQYIDPETAEAHKVAGIPVEQASSWEEGYQGSVSGGFLKQYEDEAGALGRTQYFVIAHDGDNSSGRAGDGGTWANSGNVTYAEGGITGMGVDEYLRAHPIPSNDIVHVQDGSWIDTRDSSADPTWYHWHLPMGVWNGQLAAFNEANGTNYSQLFAANGDQRSHMPSLELGYHYLERNFALLQAAENYAKTAEQIWLDDHPNHWSPTTALDNEITYPGNQLNPWMMSFPVKGDASNDYAGGANPAELAWYFLIPAIDSGFGYYDENVDDNVKPTISFNQSLHFSEPYVEDNISNDRTGPSVWWPQRYPYNPGSVNNSKAEGWATMYMNNVFAIYTYAYDVSDIEDIKVKIRVHTNKSADPKDKTYQLYDPARHASDPNVNPDNVGEWVEYSMKERDLTPDINGVEWQPSGKETFEVVPANKIGDLYYTYFDNYRDQLLDYYIEATDTKGNVTKSEIQQVYVGTGRYSMSGGKQIEDLNGSIEGEHPFFTDQGLNHKVSVYMEASTPGLSNLRVEAREDGASSWSATNLSPVNGSDVYFLYSDTYSDEVNGLWVRYQDNGQYVPNSTGVLLTEGTYTLSANGTLNDGPPDDLSLQATIYYKSSWSNTCLHFRIDSGTWTNAPGESMTDAGNGWFSYTVDMGAGEQVEFDTNDCGSTWDNNGGANYKVGPGVWSLDSGNITEGKPDDVDNVAPNAVITPGSQTVEAGTSVTLSASSSTDDKEVVSYRWSTGDTSESITVTVDQTQTISLTVSDEEGLTDTAEVTLTVDSGEYLSNLASLYFRGTPNNWGSTAMVLVDDYIWEVTVNFDGQADQRYKFDVLGDWSRNYGDNNGDGTLDSSGDDIYTDVNATCVLRVNDSTLTYTQNCNEEPLPPTAVITPENPEVIPGDTITLSAADSDDPDGSTLTYLWSTGGTAAEENVSYDEPGTYTVTLTVTASDGLEDEVSTTVTVIELPCCALVSNFDQLYFRGTPNGWATTEMTLIDSHTWAVEVDFDGRNDQRYKFDVHGDWSYNFGDNNSDGILDQTGNDIYTSVVGRYQIQVNDQDMTYSIQAAN